jgi:hypothetical protein
MSYVEKNLDNQPLFEGTQKCRTWLATTLNDPGADFKSCGAQIGAVVHNDTDKSSGLITALTENTLTVSLTGGSLNVWTNGDEYSVYATATKGSKISQIYTDRRYGRKVTDKKDLDRGLFPADVDLDEYEDNIFGPGQPRKEYVR